MKNLMFAPIVLVLTLGSTGSPIAMANGGTAIRTQESGTNADGRSCPGSECVPREPRSDSYAAREASSADLEPFVGGRQVIIATEYDFQIFVSLLLVTTLVLVIVLL